MIAGSSGALLTLGAGYDLRAATKLTLGILRPDGSIFFVSSPAVTVGTRDLSTASVYLPAFTYAQYTIAPGDCPLPGLYHVYLYDSEPGPAPKRLSSTFTVSKS